MTRIIFQSFVAIALWVGVPACAQVDEGAIKLLLLNRRIVPPFEVGYQATIGRQSMTNGQETWFAAKTIITGEKIAYRVDNLIFHGPAAHYKTFKSSTEFDITKVELTSDSINVKADSADNARLHADLRLPLPAGCGTLQALKKLLLI